MKKVKKIINKKIVITVLITMIISITIGVRAATMFSSNDVIYDNSSSRATSNTVKEALDELYEKANNCGCSIIIGTPYQIDPGDGITRTFYVLEENTDTVSLIMSENLGNTVAWNTSGSNTDGPVTALAYLEEQTSNWTVDVSLPTYDQIYNVNNSETLTNTPWLYWNSSVNRPYGYWTSTPHTRYSSNVYSVLYSGTLYWSDMYGKLTSSTSYGVRPVITIPKDQLS